MAWDPITESELIPGGNVLKHMKQAWNCLKSLYSNLGTVTSTGIQNGSFEVDSDADGTPDGWTFSAYPGGSVDIDTTTPADGPQAVAITHPGGAGNGGGVLTSDYVVCNALQYHFLSFIHWASAAGMKNRVNVRYYTAAKVYISSSTLYESTANPTAAAGFVTGFVPPATARYYRIELVGGYTDTNVAGSAYFDGLRTSGSDPLYPRAVNFTITESSTTSGSYVDIGSAVIPNPFPGLPTSIAFQGQILTSSGDTGNIRFRIGTTYSNEFTFVGPSGWDTCDFTLSITSTAANFTIYLQLKNSSGTGAISGRKTTAAAVSSFVPAAV